MKKLLIIAFLLISLQGFSQSPFKGFFRPVQDNIFEPAYSLGAMSVNPSAWLFRPTVSISAMQLIPDKEKTFIVNSFSSVGTGLSYNHYINLNGSPYSDYGFNLLVLYNYNFNGVSPLNLSFAGTVTAFQLINCGVGYSPILNKPFILTGITYSFNK
jgi:hypothetical protein